MIDASRRKKGILEPASTWNVVPTGTARHVMRCSVCHDAAGTCGAALTEPWVVTWVHVTRVPHGFSASGSEARQPKRQLGRGRETPWGPAWA